MNTICACPEIDYVIAEISGRLLSEDSVRFSVTASKFVVRKTQKSIAGQCDAPMVPAATSKASANKSAPLDWDAVLQLVLEAREDDVHYAISPAPGQVGYSELWSD